jgi:hypothetical protein
MKTTKKLTLSATLVAMGTLFGVFGAVLDVFDLTASALSSLLVAFAYIEIGSPYTWLIWLCTSALNFVLFPGKFMWLSYLLLFGVYPILKGYIERLKKPLWLILKLVFANIASLITFLVSSFVMGVPFIEEGTRLAEMNPTLAYGILLFLANIAFVAYDYFLTVLVRYYLAKLRPRLKHLLK